VWLAADPGTGQIGRTVTDAAGKVKISLKPRSAIFLIGASPAKTSN
ncbi:unnamed protein product, partial [marine sediment metagenome]